MDLAVLKYNLEAEAGSLNCTGLHIVSSRAAWAVE